MEGSDGALYGTTLAGGIRGFIPKGFGTVFRLNKDGSGYTIIHSFGSPPDGNGPGGALMEGNDGMLYGTTRGGGSNETGTVFKMNKNGANYTILYHFGPFGVDGINPYVGVIKGIDGALYGTTRYGGTNGLTPRAMAHYLRYKQMEL